MVHVVLVLLVLSFLWVVFLLFVRPLLFMYLFMAMLDGWMDHLRCWKPERLRSKLGCLPLLSPCPGPRCPRWTAPPVGRRVGLPTWSCLCRRRYLLRRPWLLLH